MLTGKAMRRLLEATLNSPGQRVRVRGRGYSMTPFIGHDCTVLLKSVDRQRGFKFGDIVAVSNKEENLVIIHRIVHSRNGRYQTKGDRNSNLDPWCDTEDIIGVVDTIEKSGRRPYTVHRWQNFLIAIASRTGILSRLIYPAYIKLKSMVKW